MADFPPFTQLFDPAVTQRRMKQVKKEQAKDALR
jgi:hypothetical protein